MVELPSGEERTGFEGLTEASKLWRRVRGSRGVVAEEAARRAELLARNCWRRMSRAVEEVCGKKTLATEGIEGRKADLTRRRAVR